jgi:hypothetical protein
MAKEIATAVPRSAADAFLTPSVGEQRYNPALSKGGNSAGITREQLAQPYDKEHGAVTGEERALAVAQTGANIIAPSMGAVPGGALVGAAYDPENPVRGAAFGAAAGAVLRAPALAERIAGVRAGSIRPGYTLGEVTPPEALGITPRRPLTEPSSAAQAARVQVDRAEQAARTQVPVKPPARSPLARPAVEASTVAMQAAQDPRVSPELQQRAADLSNRLAPELPPVKAGTRPRLVQDDDMARNMAETGFATHGATPDAVVLPSQGAGRSGSTATAVANARAKIGPERLRALADAELARRGGPVTPEAQMAAMEQVARNVASDEIAAAGGERFSGLPVSRDLRERIGTARARPSSRRMPRSNARIRRSRTRSCRAAPRRRRQSTSRIVASSGFTKDLRLNRWTSSASASCSTTWTRKRRASSRPLTT